MDVQGASLSTTSSMDVQSIFLSTSSLNVLGVFLSTTRSIDVQGASLYHQHVRGTIL
jgi:hypothetical protein